MADYDIGMIRVFVLVYETGSVTATAERLYISQPSVSYTLRKLRKLFNDPLFVRNGTRLEPTAVAQDSYPKLRRLLESLDEVMTSSASFDPATCRRRFRLRMSDVGVSGLLPRIWQRVHAQAPGASFDVDALNLATAAQELRSGQADAVVCTTRLDGVDLQRDLLFTQEYVGVCATDHPRIGDAPTLEEYEAEHHLTVSALTGHRALDLRVTELGINRRVSLVIPTFAALPNLLTGTELLSYAPTSAAQRIAATGQIRTFRLPFDVPITEIALYTVRRELPSPEFDWFRRTIVEAVQ